MSRIVRYARTEPMAAWAITCAVIALVIIPAAPAAGALTAAAAFVAEHAPALAALILSAVLVASRPWRRLRPGAVRQAA